VDLVEVEAGCSDGLDQASMPATAEVEPELVEELKGVKDTSDLARIRSVTERLQQRGHTERERRPPQISEANIDVDVIIQVSNSIVLSQQIPYIRKSSNKVFPIINILITLDNGKVVTKELFRQMLAEEREVVRKEIGEERWQNGKFEQATQLLDQITTSDELVDFLTLPAYQLLG